MKMRSLCETPGGLNAADNGANDGDPNDDFTYPSAVNFMMGSTQIGYNPNDVGIIPIFRNEADSDIEIAKQTNLWQKGTKIAASMLSFFPGTTGYMATIGQAPATFIIPDAKKTRTPLKTGLLGTILAPPEAINVVRKDEVEEPKEPGFWSKYFEAYAEAGATSTAAGGVDFVKTKGVEKAKSALTETFGPPPVSPETRSGIDAVLQIAAGKEQFNMNWLLLGGAALVVILLISR
jgi:hypothetical protein